MQGEPMPNEKRGGFTILHVDESSNTPEKDKRHTWANPVGSVRIGLYRDRKYGKLVA
jgi:hypothetical protein